MTNFIRQPSATMLQSSSRVRRLATLLATAVLGLSSFTMASPAGATNQMLNPTYNVPQGTRFDYACSYVTRSIASQTTCERAALPRFDLARRHEGLVPLVLPRGFAAMSVAQQVLVIVDLERTARGLSPVLGLMAADNRDAARAATVPEDPPAVGNVVSSDLVVNTNSALLSVFLWIYDDGWGGYNGDFLTRSAPGCCGHRDSILMPTTGFAPDGTTPTGIVMGAAWGRSRGGTPNVTAAMGVVALPATLSSVVVGYNAATGRRIASVATPGTFATRLTSDSTNVWALRTGTSPQGLVTEINPSTGAIIHTVTDPAFALPYQMLSDGSFAWVANENGGPGGIGSVTKIDAATGTVLTEITDPSFDSPQALASTGSDLWVLNQEYSANPLSEIDVATDTVVNVVPSSVINDPVAIASTGSDLWVASSTGGTNGTGTLTEIDSATAQVVQIINMPVNRTITDVVASGTALLALETVNVSVSCDGAFTCGSTVDTVREYNATTGQELPTANALANVDAVLGGATLWVVTQNGSGVLSLYNPATGRAAATLHCPSMNEEPYGMTATAGTVWIACQPTKPPKFAGPGWFALRAKYNIH